MANIFNRNFFKGLDFDLFGQFNIRSKFTDKYEKN